MDNFDTGKRNLELDPVEKIWAIKRSLRNDYYEMVQHRWISMYCLTKTFYYKHEITKLENVSSIKNLQNNEKDFITFDNKDDVSTFIRSLCNSVIGKRLKCLTKTNLSGANLSYADLSGANLSVAKLELIILSYSTTSQISRTER
jgi:hypothetical protein